MLQSVARRPLRGALAAFFALAALPASGTAQTPTVDDIVDRYVQTIGGRDAVLAATSSRTLGRMEIPAAGMSGEIEVLIAGPGDMIQRSSIAGFGESTSGMTGGRAWSVDPMQGARLVDGAEAEQMQHSADPSVALRDARHFTSREVMGERDIDGERCIEVRFVWQSGREMVDCFSIESGLIVASRSTIDSPMGSVEATTRVKEYRDFGGIRTPTLMLQDIGPFQQRITIESVEYGTVTRADVAPPAQIRTLLDG
jgi:hypothetical protein